MLSLPVVSGESADCCTRGVCSSVAAPSAHSTATNGSSKLFSMSSAVTEACARVLESGLLARFIAHAPTKSAGSTRTKSAATSGVVIGDSGGRGAGRVAGGRSTGSSGGGAIAGGAGADGCLGTGSSGGRANAGGAGADGCAGTGSSGEGANAGGAGADGCAGTNASSSVRRGPIAIPIVMRSSSVSKRNAPMQKISCSAKTGARRERERDASNEARSGLRLDITGRASGRSTSHRPGATDGGPHTAPHAWHADVE
mmetsp:Transcript_51064/g.117432  ORF Transcript_51064/g.117432 Transcript_51064/m.117432 type:complete len:256 (-) Transcript_51064:383-1150(-)